MCLYPKLVLNKKYLPTKKNGYSPPICTDERLRYVAIGCGQCQECRKQKAREWQVRLNEQLKATRQANFMTMTFSPEALQSLTNELNNNDINIICAISIRRFLERWRKKYKELPIHWFIDELGQDETERVHLHGILFTDKTKEQIQALWKYGTIDTGKYVNGRTVNYIIKYVTKIDHTHQGFIPRIWCSKGIGRNYASSEEFKAHKYKGETTRDFYKLPSGSNIAQPIYYRNKLYSEEEREKLWQHRLDRQETYVNGIRLDLKTDKDIQNYLSVLKKAQERNIALGFGDNSPNWNKKNYTITLKMLQKNKKS